MRIAEPNHIFKCELQCKIPFSEVPFKMSPFRLRGPVAILFISRDTCSDSIAKLFRACFCGVSHNYRAICCKMGYRTDMSGINESTKGGIAPFWGSANLPEKVSRDMGYRSDSIAVSRDMGPLSSGTSCKHFRTNPNFEIECL